MMIILVSIQLYNCLVFWQKFEISQWWFTMFWFYLVTELYHVKLILRYVLAMSWYILFQYIILKMADAMKQVLYRLKMI